MSGNMPIGSNRRHQKLVGLYGEKIRHSEPEPEFFNIISPKRKYLFWSHGLRPKRPQEC